MALSKSRSKKSQPTQQTFLEHILELQRRLFVVGLVFIAGAGAAFPFFEHLSNLILAPLSPEQKLVFLTPGGAFGYMIQVCVYVGIIVALPAIIFQIYRFVMPAVQKIRMRQALGYTLASCVLAVAGVAFAYTYTLPAALKFLTGFELQNINPMLTIDSYMSFVMTYLLAGAALFQLPIIMLIINTATPLTPKKMMGQQGKILLVSYIAAAIITPTPDPMNQTMLAMPIVAMYQVGIILVWLVNRKKRRVARRNQITELAKTSPYAQPANDQPLRPKVAIAPTATQLTAGSVYAAPIDVSAAKPSPKGSIYAAPSKSQVSAKSLDGMSISSKTRPLQAQPAYRPVLTPNSSPTRIVSAEHRGVRSGRSVDGFYIPARSS